MVGETSITKAEAASIFVDDRIPLLQPNDHRVQIWILKIPFLDRAQLIQSDVIGDGIRSSRAGRDGLVSSCDNAILIAKLRFQCEGCFLCIETLYEARNGNGWPIGENVPWLHKDVLDVRRGHKPQMHIAIDAAEGEVIDLASKWRNVGPLGRVELHGKHVVSFPIDVRR